MVFAPPLPLQAPPKQQDPANAGSINTFAATVHDLLAFQSPPMARVLTSSEFTIPASGGPRAVALSWDGIDYDPYGFWVARVPGRLTVPAGCDGLYVAEVVLSFAASPTTTGFTQEVGIVYSSADGRQQAFLAMDNRQSPNQNDETRNFSVVSPPWPMRAGDYVIAYGWQRSTANLATSQGQMKHSFSLRWVGALPSTPGSLNTLTGNQINALTGTAINLLVGG